jgi:hypothetical protein
MGVVRTVAVVFVLSNSEVLVMFVTSDHEDPKEIFRKGIKYKKQMEENEKEQTIVLALI